MIRIFKLVVLLVISQVAFGQAPSNYTNINGRYRWIAGMFDSTFHIPKGSTPSLRTGGSTNSGGLFYNTSDSSVYTYTGTQWIKLRGSINPSDTTNKYVTQVYKKSGSDSVFYVKGGVHTWAFNDSTGSPGGGGGGKIYYFNGGVSMGTIGGLQMYELGDTANTGAAANFTRSTTGNIANFITDPGKPGLLQIPAGVWSVDAWLSETGGGANHAEIWIEVEKWDGSTITTIATSPIEQITEGSTPNLYSWSVSIPTTSLTVTDRIIIQFYISNTNGKTVTLYTQNGYVGEVHTTFTTGIGAINGLTAPAQYLVTGTSGVDFNISSATATHTFNLPTASSMIRGALSPTDWSAFNNKIGPSDTASMLSPYFRLAGVGLKNTGQTVYADTLLLSTRAWRQKGIDSVAALINSNVSGTTNYVAKFTGSNTIGNSQIIDNGTAVAIGTAPSNAYKLSVAGIYRGVGVGDAARIELYDTQSGGATFFVNPQQSLGVTSLGTYGAYPISFVTNNSERMRLDASGNLGLGTSSPSYNLDVNGNFGLNTAGTGLLGLFGANNTTDKYIRIRNSSGNFELGTVSTEHYLVGNGSIPLRIYTNGTLRATLDASGNLGLGVSPSAWTVFNPVLQVKTGSLASSGTANFRMFANTFYDGAYKYIGTGTATQYEQDGYHAWSTAPSGTAGTAITFTERMRLDNSGNLGLGVTPSAWGSNRSAFQFGALGAVFSDNNVTSEIGANVYISTTPAYAYITSNFATRFAQINGQFQWHQAPSGTAGNAISFTQAMTLDASGNLGVGTTVPGVRLHAEATNSNVAIINVIGTAPNYIFDVRDDGVSKFRVDPSGNVGIGTTSPNSFVEMSKSSNSGSGGTFPRLAIKNTLATQGDGSATFNFADINISSGNEAVNMFITTTYASGTWSPAGIINVATNHDLQIKTNNTERMRITSGGELLINTTSDAGDYKLQVNGASYMNNLVINRGGGSWDITPNNASNFLYFRELTGSAYPLTLDGTNVRVGINTTTPTATLEVNGSIKTAAPSGGTAKPWKFGEAGVSVGGANTTAVKVEIDGVVYYLLTAYLPEPAPESAPKPKPEG